ncbi:Hypothetical predicted protein [Mytilus galloprovincialis]|uniref:B box-type domain-containing protein n=1 Tax=Mytilus galloprovincialis TaxID=29158 RepID=A0A8B6G2R2_MYTGA|nr:Hypothetical predicted protein [Mytilus galloprovincialis]
MSVYKCYDCNLVLCEDCSRRHCNENKYQSHSMQLISDSFILNHKFCVENEIISDIKYLPSRELILAFYITPNIMILSVSGKQRHVVHLEDYPRMMHLVDKNNVAVSLQNKNVNIVGIQKRVVPYVENIAINYKVDSFIYIENRFFIGDEFGIVVLDMSGSVQRHIPLSFTPCDMCYDVDSQHIYCIESENSQLICIARDGTIVFTYTDPSMTNLNDVTMDNEGNVLVLCRKKDDNSGYVLKVDSSGKKSEVVITNINTSPFDSRICYDHLTNSVVIGVRDTVYNYKRKA